MNLESTPLVVLGVLTGIVLAVVVLLVKDPRVLLAVGAVSVAFAALDLLEFTTRSGERSAVLGVAGALIAVHLFIAALAFWGFSRERAGPAETSPGE